MPDFALPFRFNAWFAARGWTPRPHQLALAERGLAGLSTLLIAPPGAGKTMAGFLPSLIALADQPAERPHRLHTLYLSPLKALTADIHRNLQAPVAEMGLPLRIETRTGDTPPAKRLRQRARPPDILLTTPEQLCLLMASGHARAFFEDVEAVIIDEAHALAPTKRGDLMALALSQVSVWAPRCRRVGLSATVAEPQALARWIGPEVEVLHVGGGAAPIVEVLDAQGRIPWAGHTGRHAMAEVYEAIKQARTALIFVNTRAQAELVFQELWRVNDDGLSIALHHGSLDVEQRRKVETAMAKGLLQAVVCTSTLDLGVDWGDVDLVIQLGAPKGAARLVQRIGRANHRLHEPSRALLVPTNRFEVLECRAARDAVAEGAMDGSPMRIGGLDCLAQHIMGCACGDPFDEDELYKAVIAADPYKALPRSEFDKVLDFVAVGGYALKAYDRFRRIIWDPKTKRWRAKSPAIAQQHRMNVGAIIEAAMLDVRLVSRSGSGERRTSQGIPGRRLGRIEEWFVEGLAPGDTFLFAGEVLRFVGLRDLDCLVARAPSNQPPRIPSYAGGKFPLSTFLASRVRAMLHDSSSWERLPEQVSEWLRLQQSVSMMPKPDHLLIETFPRADKYYLLAYPFDGRLAHQTLGMLLSRRLERAGAKPMGFVASEYALSVWALEDMAGLDFDDLFAEDMLGDDLESWLGESALMKRTFRDCAVIAGMIDRKAPGLEKTGRQVTFSADLIYDVLRRHEPDHVLLRAAFQDAGDGFLDLRRLGALLARIRGKITHARLSRISPFAVPMMLEIGREPVFGAADEAILEALAAEMMDSHAMGGEP